MVIGGAEDKKGKCKILREFVDLSGGPDSVIGIITSATKEDDESGRLYEELFYSLGASSIKSLCVNSRSSAESNEILSRLGDCTGIFFTGGDQLRITTILGGTRFENLLKRKYEEGAIIAGTSAGASAMSETMIISGPDDDSARKCTLKMAPGLGLLKEVVIDQHFAQRGRIGRLLTAVAQNPLILGVGIDEDTAILVNPEAEFGVIGSQAVTVIDGRSIDYTNVSDLAPDEVLTITDITLHVLSEGYRYDMCSRRPIRADDRE